MNEPMAAAAPKVLETYILPSLDANPDIVVTQSFSRRAMGFLRSKRAELDVTQMAHLDATYNNRKKSMLLCEQKITYRLKKPALGFGRFYGSAGSLEVLQKEIRGTLCNSLYDDYDIVNAHPVLCVQFARRYFGYSLPYLRGYVKNREEYLSRFPSREEGKEAFIRILYGGGGEPEDSPFGPLITEMREFTHFVKKQSMFEPLLCYATEKAKTHNRTLAPGAAGRKSANGIFLSLILQTEERRCLKALVAEAAAQGFPAEVLAYDGFMARKQEVTAKTVKNSKKGKKDVEESSPPSLDISRLEAAVRTATGYRVNVLQKPMETLDMPDMDEEELVPGVLRADYEAMKTEFESNHFFLASTDEFAEVKPDGSLLMKTRLRMREYLEPEWNFRMSDKHGDYIPFFDLWLKDTTRKAIHSIDMKPTPDDPTVFSVPLRFTYNTPAPGEGGVVPTVSEKRRIEILDMFDELMNTLIPDPEVRVEVLQWFAHIIQRPFENPLMAIIMSGGKGCGKDTLGDFFSAWVLGSVYSKNYDSTTQFWDKHDVGRLNKLFVKLEEAQGSKNIEFSSELKARVTSVTMEVNPKGSRSITAPNYGRMYFTANEGIVVEVTADGRRYLLVPCGRTLIGDYDFWKRLRAILFTREGGIVIGELFEKLDVGEWPRPLMQTSLMRTILEANKSSEQRFIDNWDGKEIGATAFYREYKQFCIGNELPYAANVVTLGKKMVDFIRDGALLKRETKGGNLYYKDIPTV